MTERIAVPNPFYDEFIVARKKIPSWDWDAQHEYLHRYSWSVPTQEALDAIQDFAADGIVELGAGTGYWASLLLQMGVDIIAYDSRPVEEGKNKYHPGVKSHTRVLRGGVNMVSYHPSRALMLCWPPNGFSRRASPMSHEALARYAGSRLVYIGGAPGSGWTGTEEFHADVRKNWFVIKKIPLPHFGRIRNALYLYERKPNRAVA